MSPGLFLLCWAPVFLLIVLAVVLRRPAVELSIYGALFSFGLVVFLFDTPASVALLSALDGILTTLPLILVIFAGIVLSSLLLSTGSLERLVAWFAGGVRNSFHRNILITLGICNFMEGAGVIAEPVAAPMLRAAGVSPPGAAALSIVGYAGLMTLELGGIIVFVLSLLTGIPVETLAVASAWLSIPATVLMAACIPVFLPEFSVGLQRFMLPAACGLLVGMVALGVTAFIGVAVSGMFGGLALMVCLVAAGSRRLEANRQIFCDAAPFIFILASLLLVNTVPFLRELAFHRLSFEVRIIPVHAVTFRPFFSAYLYLSLAFGLAAGLLQVPGSLVREVLGSGARKGLRASVAMALFGSMGQMITYSGYDTAFVQLHEAYNIPWILSKGLEAYTGTFYPVFVPLLGWVGTFLTGYGVASLMLFARLQLQAAAMLGASPTWLSAGLAVGASLGSISSPFKIAIAAAMCGALGREGEILRWTVPLGVAASMVIGAILWVVV